jgi:hypothetical protein
MLDFENGFMFRSYKINILNVPAGSEVDRYKLYTKNQIKALNFLIIKIVHWNF